MNLEFSLSGVLIVVVLYQTKLPSQCISLKRMYFVLVGLCSSSSSSNSSSRHAVLNVTFNIYKVILLLA